MLVDVSYIAVATVAFFLGYFFARLDSLYVLLRRGTAFSPTQDTAHSPVSFFEKERRADTVKKQLNKLGGIEIDSSKVVTHIDTAGIQKGSDAEFGRTTAQQDTLHESVSKLSQLKGR